MGILIRGRGFTNNILSIIYRTAQRAIMLVAGQLLHQQMNNLIIFLHRNMFCHTKRWAQRRIFLLLSNIQSWARENTSGQRDHVFRPTAWWFISLCLYMLRLFRHRNLNIFRIFFVNENLTCCRAVVVAKLNNCRVPSSANNNYSYVRKNVLSLNFCLCTVTHLQIPVGQHFEGSLSLTSDKDKTFVILSHVVVEAGCEQAAEGVG